MGLFKKSKPEDQVKLEAELESMKSKLASYEGVDITALQAQLAELTQAKTTLEASVTSLQTEIVDLKSKLEESNKQAELTNKKVIDAAVDLVADQGVPIIPILPEDTKEDEIVAKFNSIKNPTEAREYWVKNYAVLSKKR
jgi:predicted nuclease with TOPRIM domain